MQVKVCVFGAFLLIVTGLLFAADEEKEIVWLVPVEGKKTINVNLGKLAADKLRSGAQNAQAAAQLKIELELSKDFHGLTAWHIMFGEKAHVASCLSAVPDRAIDKIIQSSGGFPVGALLHAAVSKYTDRPEHTAWCIKLLLDSKANPYAQDQEGKTPLYRAVNNGSVVAVTSLLSSVKNFKIDSAAMQRAEATTSESPILAMLRVHERRQKRCQCVVS